MKNLVAMIALCGLLFSCSKGGSSSSKKRPHLPPGMSADELRAVFEANPELRKDVTDPVLRKGLIWGDRLAEWLKVQNENRTAENAILLNRKVEKNVAGPDKPMIYSVKSTEARMQKIIKTLDADMLAYLNGTGPMPKAPEKLSDDQIKNLRAVNGVYSTAARIQMSKPYMAYYKAVRRYDVRAYFFFKKRNWTPEMAKTIETMPEAEKKEVTTQAKAFCLMAYGLFDTYDPAEECEAFMPNIANEEGKPTWELMLNAGASVWSEYFDIEKSRPDIISEENVMTIPFKNPGNDAVARLLKINVEDEFRWKEWGLKMDFRDVALAHIRFERGVTPHVNGEAGNEITMDENINLEEGDSKWTIRHEFGHVLGFPDCYMEFYEEENEAFVQYALDPDDLMCIYGGKMTERMHKDLIRTYPVATP